MSTAALASSAGYLHPVCALWRSIALSTGCAIISTPAARSLRGFAEHVGLTAVAWPSAPIDPFFNINTRDELDRAEAIAARPGIVIAGQASAAQSPDRPPVLEMTWMPLDDHRPVDRLQHVEQGQAGDRDRGQRLHLDAGRRRGCGLRRRPGSRAARRRSRSSPPPWSAAAGGRAGSGRRCAWPPSSRPARRSGSPRPWAWCRRAPARASRACSAAQPVGGGDAVGRRLVRHVDHRARPSSSTWLSRLMRRGPCRRGIWPASEQGR